MSSRKNVWDRNYIKSLFYFIANQSNFPNTIFFCKQSTILPYTYSQASKRNIKDSSNRNRTTETTQRNRIVENETSSSQTEQDTSLTGRWNCKRRPPYLDVKLAEQWPIVRIENRKNRLHLFLFPFLLLELSTPRDLADIFVRELYPFKKNI